MPFVPTIQLTLVTPKSLSMLKQTVSEEEQIERRFLIQWILANSLGIGAGITAGWVFSGVPLAVVVRGVLWTVIGVLTGFLQKQVLHRHLRPNGWIWVSTLGWTVGGLLAGGENVDWAIIGLTVGLAQWLSLRQVVNRAFWWVLANGTGLVLGGFVGGSIILLEDFYSFKTQVVIINMWGNEMIGWIASGVIGGATSGAITGLWLVWLLRSKFS